MYLGAYNMQVVAIYTF